MSSVSSIGLISQRINRFYSKYVRRRIRAAICITVVFSLGMTGGVYILLESIFLAIPTFVLTTFLAINVSLFCVVPPNRKLMESKSLIMASIQNPSRIQTIDEEKIILSNALGETFELDPLNQRLWEVVIVPHLIKGGGEIAGPPTDSVRPCGA